MGDRYDDRDRSPREDRREDRGREHRSQEPRQGKKVSVLVRNIPDRAR